MMGNWLDSLILERQIAVKVFQLYKKEHGQLSQAHKTNTESFN